MLANFQYSSILGKAHGLQDASNDTVILISHAAEQRLRNVLERLTACSVHRSDPHKVNFYM